jgi:eukaryotic-like serine/threonine-protein kinase
MGIGGFFKSLIEGGKVDVAKRYEILREAVSGTMSSFYMARDRQTEQIVGLKILDKKKTEDLEMRFRGLDKPTEGQISAMFNHPRIVTPLGHGVTSKGEQFVVMEYLDGPGLNSLIIGRSKLLDGNRLALMLQAADALQTVHDAGFIHRDVCPRNFVQQPGIRTGTPNYMAPEVVRRRPTDQRIDVFAYGVSMYEMFAFELPWQRGSGDGLAAMGNAQSKPRPLESHYPKIHPTLRDVIHKCLEPEPDARFQTMKQMLNAMKSVKHEDVK